MIRHLRPITLLAALAATVVLPAGNAHALVSWQLHNFGANAFDENNNWSPVSYPGIGHLPSPGGYAEGGEKYDIEGMFGSFSGGYLNMAVTSSFGTSQWSPSWSRYYGAGDLFLDLGSDGSYEYAIERSSGHLFSGAGVAGWMSISNTPGTYYSNAAIRNQVGAWRINHGLGVVDHGAVAMAVTHYGSLETTPMAGGSADTFVWEVRVPYALMSGISSASSLRMHQTIECGNDLGEREIAPPVPEPGTVLLLGSSLAGSGLVAIRRRRSRP